MSLRDAPLSIVADVKAQPEPLTLGEAFERIQGEVYAPEITRIRDAYQQFCYAVDAGLDGEEVKRRGRKVDELKCQLLPAMMFGRFSAKGGTNCEGYAGLLAADLDHLPMFKARQVATLATADPHVALAFTSPKATGYKILFRVPGAGSAYGAQLERQHEANFRAVQKHVMQRYGVGMDPHCSDIQHLCFFSSDANAILREEATVLPVPLINPSDPKESGNLTRPYITPAALRAQWADYYDKTAVFMDDSHRELFQQLVLDRYKAEQGCRNRTLVQMMVFLYHAVHPHVALDFAARWYKRHAVVFVDSEAQHMREAQAMLTTVANTYTQRQNLTPAEKEYLDLQLQRDRERDSRLRQQPEELSTAFRIVRDMALRGTEGPWRFPLSGHELTTRLGRRGDPIGDRILKRFEQEDAIRVVCRGQKRTRGQRARATIWEWQLGKPEASMPVMAA